MLRKEHDIIKRKLSFVAEYNTQQENFHAIVNLMKAMKDVTYLLQYSSNFRRAFIERCKRFADLDSGEYATTLITDDEKQVLVILSQENLQRLETHPFLREVASSCKDTWTAVGAGPPDIVEQTVEKVVHSYDYSDEAWEARWARREEEGWEVEWSRYDDEEWEANWSPRED
jgi:hypothetical protein